MAIPYVFQKVTEDTLASSKEAWKAQLEENPSLKSWTSLEVWFQYFERDIEGTAAQAAHGAIARGDGVGGIYGVFHSSDPTVALALCNMHLNGHQQTLKMMDLNVSPSLDVSVSDLAEDLAEEHLVMLAWVAASAITGAMDLMFEDFPAAKLKIFVDVPFTREFLTGIATALVGTSKAVNPFHVSHEGRFLCVSRDM